LWGARPARHPLSVVPDIFVEHEELAASRVMFDAAAEKKA
jgi:hypothetical protein